MPFRRLVCVIACVVSPGGVACGAEPPPVTAPVVAGDQPAQSPSPTVVPSSRAPKSPPRGPTGTRLTDDAIVLALPIVFASGSASLMSESDVALDGAAAILDANRSVTIEVQVHTDSLGAVAYNRALSQARAESVVKALVARGIDGARLTARGYGETRPIVPNDTPEHRATNRRTELVRTDGK